MTVPLLPANAGECVNMRPEVGGTGSFLVPVMPAAIVFDRAWRHVGAYMLGNDTVLELLADGDVLGACTHAPGGDVPEPYIVAEGLEGDIVGSYSCDDGYMILTTALVYHVVFDADTMMLRCELPVVSSRLPTFGIIVVSETSMSVPVASFKLSGHYGSSSVRLDAADATRLSNYLVDAYGRACADAAASGQYIAPVLARYRLFDRRGELIFESVPKLMVPTGRHDRTMTTELGVDSAFAQVAAGGMPVPLFKIGLAVPVTEDASVVQHVARLEVQLTPQLHSAASGLSAAHRLSAAGNSKTLTVTMPGCDSTGKATARFRRKVLRAVAACDSLFETVLTVENPLSAANAGKQYVLDAVNRTMSEDEAMLKASVADDTDLWLSRCRIPHAVTGAVGVRDAGTTLLANLSVKLFEGHRLEYYGNHGTLLDDIKTVSAVTFPDGSRTVVNSLSRGWRSMKMSPLIVYPDSMACSIELQLCDSDGNNHSLTLPLTPCGRFACFMNETLWPLDLEDGGKAFSIPESTMQPLSYPGNIIAYSGNRPGDDITGREIGYGRINAVVTVGQPSASAWESSRSRYNVMGSDGIFTLSMNRGLTVTPVLLDSRPVTRPDAVTVTRSPTSGNRVYALAGGDMVYIDGNRVKTVVAGIGASMLAWDNANCELLAVRPPSSGISQALVMHTNCNGWSTRMLPAVTSVYSNHLVTRLVSLAEGMVYDPCRGAGDLVRCRFVCELKQKVAHMVREVPFITEVDADITGSRVDGTVEISGHHGRGPWRIFSRLTIEGELNRPVAHHTLMPPRRVMRVAIDAILSADARLGEVGIMTTLFQV